MPSERSMNPAAAQRKADKQREISKSKRNLQNQRNEKLARRNPDRVQRQIDELKALESTGALRQKDKDTLAQLERDLKGIRRARDALGDAAPKLPSHERRDHHDARQEQRDRRQNLGKRRRDEDEVQSSDTDPEVRDIPMPRDTPPPLPRTADTRSTDSQTKADGTRVPHVLPVKPAPLAPLQTVYSSAPQLRDLKKEATKFVPSAVAQKKRQVKGEGRLLEPEEIERLEQAGYYAAQKAASEAGKEAAYTQAQAKARAEGLSGRSLDEEFKRFEQEVNDIYSAKEHGGIPLGVQVEEVEDAGD